MANKNTREIQGSQFPTLMDAVKATKKGGVRCIWQGSFLCENGSVFFNNRWCKPEELLSMPSFHLEVNRVKADIARARLGGPVPVQVSA